MAAELPEGEAQPSPDEARRRVERAIALGLIEVMPGNPDWMRVVDRDWWIKAGTGTAPPDALPGEQRR